MTLRAIMHLQQEDQLPALAVGALGTLSWSDLEADAVVEWPGLATDDVAALLKNSWQWRPFRAASCGTASWHICSTGSQNGGSES